MFESYRGDDHPFTIFDIWTNEPLFQSFIAFVDFRGVYTPLKPFYALYHKSGFYVRQCQNLYRGYEVIHIRLSDGEVVSNNFYEV